MKRIVIVEGPTACGKTTLVSALAAELLYPVRHYPVPPDPFNGAALERHYLAALAPAPAILDRWLYSNRAYSTVFDNQAAVPFWRCEMAADKEHPLVVFMHCPVETLLDRMRKRNKVLTPHNVNDPKMLKSLVERFDEIESGCGLPKVGVWSDGSMPLEAVMARVLSEVNR